MQPCPLPGYHLPSAMKYIKKFWATYVAFPAGAKASIWFVFCSVMQKGIQFITVPIFTRTLSTQEYGQFTLYQSWLNIITIFASLMLYSSVFNNGMLKYGQQKDRFIAALQGLSTTSTAVLFVLYLAGADLWDRLIGLPRIIMLSMFLEMLFYPALQYWSMRQRYTFRYRALVAVTLAISILNPVLGLLAVRVTDEKGVARILSVSLLNACVGLLFYIHNFAKGRLFYVREYWKFALAFNLPLIPHFLSTVVFSQSDRIMIEKMFGATPMAIYSLAYSLGVVMSIVYTAITDSLVPWIYQQCQAAAYARIGHLATRITVLVALITLVPIAMAPELVAIMGPAEYAPAMWGVPPVAIASYMSFLCTLFSSIEFYFEKSKFVMVASCASALINIALNFLLMPVFGYMAAAYTTVICYGILALAHYFFMQLAFRENVGSGTVYNRKMLVFITAALALAAALLMLLYPYPLVRYLFLAALLILAVFKRRTIFSLIRRH